MVINATLNQGKLQMVSNAIHGQEYRIYENGVHMLYIIE